MHSIKSATIEAFNMLTDSFRYPPKGQRNLISFATFSTTPRSPRFIHADPLHLPRLDFTNYNPDGYTALLDSVGQAIDIFDAVPEDGDDNSFLILAITDGEENKSRRYNQFNFAHLLNRYDRENWTVTFQVPLGHASQLCRQYGVPPGNVKEWEQTEQGTRETFAETQDAMSNFYQSRESGQRATKSFFAKVQTAVPTNAKNLLKDLSKSFKPYQVVSEAIIREFVESKTGENYQPGQAFYQLIKKETVQPNKEVLVQEKLAPGVRRKSRIFGGPQARDLIGLPTGEYAKVDPGNHGDYDVFVQSRSVNRILPRGTKVLVRV